MRKGKKEISNIFLRPPGTCLASHFWTLRRLKEFKRMGRQVRTQDKQPGPQPANPDGPIYSKPMPGAPHTWEPPGLREL